MKKLLFLALFLLQISLVAISQSLPTIILPTTNAINSTIYIDFNKGNDLNSGLTNTAPVKTFDKALRLCPWGTVSNKTTNSEIVILAGTYLLSESLTQPAEGPSGYFQKLGTDTLFRNVSLRGDGTVVLDGSALSLSSGNCVVKLCGSNISIKNLTIKNSGSNGLGVQAGAHDIDIEYVIVDGAMQFGLFLDEVTRALVQYCTFTNCNLNNKNQVMRIDTSLGNWGSALKCRFSTHITFKKNKVYRNWGEGINFNKSSYCGGYSNEAYDNYATNFYCDNASNTVIRNNLIYNTTDSTFWMYTTSNKVLTTNRKSATIINIGNESYKTYKGFQNTKNIFFFDNIAFNGEIQIGNGGFAGSSFENVYIVNNTSIGLVSGKSTFTSLFYPKPVSSTTVYKNINITNNIFSLDPNIQQNSEYWKLCSLSQTALSPELKFGNNYWSCSPVKARYNCIYNPTTDSINSALPYTVTKTNLSILKPSNNSLTLSRPVSSVKGITFDYAFVSRNAIRSNVGAYENTVPVLKSGKIEQESETNTEKQIHIFPNPSSNGEFKIALGEKCSNRPILVEIFSSEGKLVFKQVFEPSELITIKVNTLGLLVLRLTSGENVFSEKIIAK